MEEDYDPRERIRIIKDQTGHGSRWLQGWIHLSRLSPSFKVCLWYKINSTTKKTKISQNKEFIISKSYKHRDLIIFTDINKGNSEIRVHLKI